MGKMAQQKGTRAFIRVPTRRAAHLKAFAMVLGSGPADVEAAAPDCRLASHAETKRPDSVLSASHLQRALETYYQRHEVDAYRDSKVKIQGASCSAAKQAENQAARKTPSRLFR